MQDLSGKPGGDKFRIIAWMTLILFIAFLVRIYGFSGGIWTDEFATYWVSNADSLRESIQRVVVTQGQSPFYYLLERAVLGILPHNEISLRILSLTASLCSVVLIYLLVMQTGLDRTKACLASAIFALSEPQIYNAQEARPYALGIMMILCSQIFFLRILTKNKNKDLILYIVFSILTGYCHYVFASLLIVQNIYFLYKWRIGKNKDGPGLLKWFAGQFIIGLGFMLLAIQIYSMLQNRSSWNWLKTLSIYDAGKLFVFMFDPPIFIIICLFFATARYVFKQKIKNDNKLNTLIFLALWLLVPFVFALVVSYLLKISLMTPRYLVLCLLPYNILTAWLLTVFSSKKLNIAFICSFFLLYLGIITVPDFIGYGTFSRRIQHNWQGAIKEIKDNFNDGDVILLRTGLVKENWLPETNSMLVKEYVKAPFHSFYWPKEKNAPIYNLTYTWENSFNQYFSNLFNEVTKKRRIWLIGVNPPNTNYPMANVPAIMEKFGFKKKLEKNYSGVYLALMIKAE